MVGFDKHVAQTRSTQPRVIRQTQGASQNVFISQADGDIPFNVAAEQAKHKLVWQKERERGLLNSVFNS